MYKYYFEHTFFTLFDNYVHLKLKEKVDTLIHFASIVEYKCTQ